jgi:hypothetical protein
MKSTWSLMGLTLLIMACPAITAPTAVPTETPVPSATASPLPTFTATALFTLPLETATAEGPTGEALDCRPLTQAVRNGTRLGPKEYFDMAWKVRNTGEAVWDPGIVEFRYFSGTRLQVSDVSQLTESVGPGQTGLLVADMVTPKSSGSYTTVWALWRGDEDFCHVNLTIRVR